MKIGAMSTTNGNARGFPEHPQPAVSRGNGVINSDVDGRKRRGEFFAIAKNSKIKDFACHIDLLST